MKFYFSLVFLLVSLITCKNHETHEIVDNLILSSIIEQKYKIKIEQYYQDNLDDLFSILTQLELDIKEKNNLDKTAEDINEMISTYKNKYDNVEFEYPIDSLIAELNSPNINIDSKKYICFYLIRYMTWIRTSIGCNDNWKIRLLNLDTVYIPNHQKMSYLYMLINPMGDTIRATDMNYGSALGDKKTIDITVNGRPGEIIKKMVKLPIRNPVTGEVHYYKDTIIFKIVKN
ncbi:MAG TPA: hypothetical protein P5235_03110 [Saprospiraceae bacterium]|nr:hypothetical protein [Saprospiraceae bacterium]MCB0699952.1 hypothetical protein [Chitinophagaceae bacterium]MCB9327176.1 hypothetical protein [Lewinellaceae bacterium]HRX28346.1 hypothetical protein [Saprospiraceae bacterium]